MGMKPKGVKSLTDSLFFDSDCISAFLWVANQNLLARLYPGRIIIPKPVYDELSNPYTPHLKERVDRLVNAGDARVEAIDTGTDDYALYYQLISSPEAGHVIIGRGEAASIALAKSSDGIVASNNLKDISTYIKEFDLKHVTTGDILIQALEEGYITEAQGNAIWASMLAKRRKLGAPSFTEYLQSKCK